MPAERAPGPAADHPGVLAALTAVLRPAVAEFRAEALTEVDALPRSGGAYDCTFVRLDLLAHRAPAE